MSCCANIANAEALHQAQAQTMLQPDEERLRASSLSAGDGFLCTRISVPNMHCAACISKIERSLRELPHVITARANLSLRRVEVVWNPDVGAGEEVISTLDGLGFENFVMGDEDKAVLALEKEGKQLLLSLAVAGFAAANIMLLSVSIWSGADAQTTFLFHFISGLIAIPAVAFAGRPFFSSAIKALSARRLNMDVPISLAVLLALGMGIYETVTWGSEAYFDACVTLLFFLLVGRYLDHQMRHKARSSVESLAKIASKGGLLVGDDGLAQYVSQSEIVPGDRLRVLPGERVPVDGVIASGSTDLDRSLVTGESASVLATVEDAVEAGVLNLTGPFDMIASKDAQTSFTAEIMKMMQAAENGRSRYVRIAERAAAIYAPAVHLLALATFAFWMVATGGDWKPSLYTAIAVLIITCPCALGLAVPVVHVIGASRLLKEGILMRDGSAFERLAEIDTVAFDKTGTLTMGTRQWVGGDVPCKRDGNVIAAMAHQTSHPVAASLKAKFHCDRDIDLVGLKEFSGYGIEAKHEGSIVRLGRPEWVAEIAVAPKKLNRSATVAFARQNGPSLSFQLGDTLRNDAKATVSTLENNGLHTLIMSGDRNDAVRQIADETGIRQFLGTLTPSAKVQMLEKLSSEDRKVMMVGDGLNDAPALAASHVSMAPSSASEIGRQAADFVFTRASLNAVAFSWVISKRTRKLIQQNFAIAIVYNCIAVPLAMLGHVTPLIAAIAMSSSSILVIANSMRLNFESGRGDVSHSKNASETEPLGELPTSIRAGAQ